MNETLTAVPPRRTQAERTALTQEALLEATIRVLVAHGYNGMTTADVARVAGVTRGAQAHHFGGKNELVSAALVHLFTKLSDSYAESMPKAGAKPMRAIERIIDALWEMHRSDLFTAAFELWVAARTDEELRLELTKMEALVVARVAEMTYEVVPEAMASSGALGVMSTTMATLRGLAMLTFVHDDVSREWRAARAQLLALWRPLLEHANLAASS